MPFLLSRSVLARNCAVAIQANDREGRGQPRRFPAPVCRGAAYLKQTNTLAVGVPTPKFVRMTDSAHRLFRPRIPIEQRQNAALVARASSTITVLYPETTTPLVYLDSHFEDVE